MKENLKNVFYILLLIAHSFSFAQHPENKKQEWAYVNKPDANLKFQVYRKHANKPANQGIPYYWYKFNEIHITQGGYEGKLLHGSYSSFYRSNNLKEKGKFKKGLKEGKWISWYENGRIMETVHWRNGMKHGSYKMFNEKGGVTLEAKYKKGLLHGTMTSYNEEIKILSSKQYKNGQEVTERSKFKLFKNKKDNSPKSENGKTSFKEKLKKIFPKKKSKEPQQTQS